MEEDEKQFNTNKQPGFHILISLIEIWTPKDKKHPNEPDESGYMRICEVEEVEIEESYKQLIGTASVRFPRGTVIRKTITADTAEKEGDYNKVSVKLDAGGVVEETRTNTSVATTDTFKIGQRIKIYLGYTTDPHVADLAKTNRIGKSIYNDENTYNQYLSNFNPTGTDQKRYMNLMFNGYITRVSLDTPIELECENLASALKTVTCPKTGPLKKCEVKDLLGENGRWKLLEGTGLKLHRDTANMDFDLGIEDLSTDLTVADVLNGWAKYGLFCYVSEDSDGPAIQIGRAYFSNPGPDSILNATPTSQIVPIHFDYHVANNGLSLTSTDKDFLALEAKGVDDKDKFINITIIRNADYDDSQPESESNPRYRLVNQTKLSKKAMKAGKRYITDAPDFKVDMKLYTKIAFISKTIPTTIEKLAEEATKYLEGYNMNGIEGSLTLFGDLHLKTAQKVRLIDNQHPGKKGVYIVEEVNTTFGTRGFRQKITLPYCIKREGNGNG